MATFNVVTGEKRDKLFKLQSLGKTKAMSDIMTALARINKNDTDAEAGNWASFKEAFKDFGFTVVYDRNMAILITALFAAIAQSGFSDLRTWAKNAISKTTAANKGNKNIGIEKGDQINLGQALLNGDGKAVHNILAQSGAQNMLENTIGIDPSCAVKFLNRVKKITPWSRLSGSKQVLEVVKNAFEQMTNEDYDELTIDVISEALGKNYQVGLHLYTYFNQNVDENLLETYKKISDVHTDSGYTSDFQNFCKYAKQLSRWICTIYQELLNKSRYKTVALNMTVRLKTFLLAMEKIVHDQTQKVYYANVMENIIKTMSKNLYKEGIEYNAHTSSHRVNEIIEKYTEIIKLSEYKAIKWKPLNENSTSNKGEHDTLPAAKPKASSKPPTPAMLETQRDPRIFRGLLNDGYYCYLNTALQELYALPNFRKKVLECKIPEIEDPKTDEYKELRATKFFFEYLEYGNTDFFNKRKEMAQNLKYIHEYDNSYGIKQFIEESCRNQLKQLKRQPTSGPLIPEAIIETENISVEEYLRYSNEYLSKIVPPLQDDNNILKTAISIFRLYEDEHLREKILKLQDTDFFLNENYLGYIYHIFKKIHEKEYNNSGLKELIEKIENKRWGYQYSKLKQLIEEGLKKIARSKHSRLLYKDSTILIYGNDVSNKPIFGLLESHFNKETKEGKTFLFALKDKRFNVTFGDYERFNRDISVDEELNLQSLVEKNILKIFVREKVLGKKINRELAPNECKFKLISASIGTGGHYYLYKKTNGGWKQFNDSSVVEICKFEDIQSDISRRCESLTYELIT